MPLFILASDIADAKRLRNVAKICERYGDRLQKSVFLLELETKELKRLQSHLSQILMPEEDTVRYYPICRRDLTRTQGLGLCNGVQRAPSHWLI